MDSIAIFVEGLTERMFVKKLIYKRYSHYANIIVKEMVLKGKDKYFNPISVSQEQLFDYLFLINEAPEYKSMIDMVYTNANHMITNKGYSMIIGLRDLLPEKRERKAHVIDSINKFLCSLPVKDKISIIIAIMETEAWFLYDWGLFQKINGELTAGHIKDVLNIDLVNDDPELKYPRPKKVIDDILKLVNLRYRKHKEEINMITSNIDYENMFSCCSNHCNSKIDSFQRFIRKIDCCGIL